MDAIRVNTCRVKNRKEKCSHCFSLASPPLPPPPPISAAQTRGKFKVSLNPVSVWLTVEGLSVHTSPCKCSKSPKNVTRTKKGINMFMFIFSSLTTIFSPSVMTRSAGLFSSFFWRSTSPVQTWSEKEKISQSCSYFNELLPDVHLLKRGTVVGDFQEEPQGDSGFESCRGCAVFFFFFHLIQVSVVIFVGKEKEGIWLEGIRWNGTVPTGANFRFEVFFYSLCNSRWLSPWCHSERMPCRGNINTQMPL